LAALAGASRREVHGVVLSDLFPQRPRCILILATGGGGDAGSAAVLAAAAARAGAEAVVAAIPWERYVRDPLPGPIPLHRLAGVEPTGTGLAARIPQRGCSAVRGGRLLVPAACAAAEALPGLTFYLLEGWEGPSGAARAVEEVASLHGCDAAMVFDVGGDVLACGCEPGLWSPLADAVGLAAALEARLGETLVAVHSPGADGELSEGEVLGYVARAARRRGYRWARGLSSLDLEALEAVLARVYTEAGRPQLEALRGRWGRLGLRGGTRAVEVGLLQALTVFLDAETVASWALGGRLLGAWGLEEARRRLNMLGVYTELDLEEDVSLFAARHGRLPRGDELVRLREEGRRRLGPCRACTPG